MEWICPLCGSIGNSMDCLICPCGYEIQEKDLQDQVVPEIRQSALNNSNYTISKAGLTVAISYFVMFVVIFSFLLYSARTNPADSGEGGLLLIPFVLPWFGLVPDTPFRESITTLLLWLSALINAIIIYFVCGGATALKVSRNKRKNS